MSKIVSIDIDLVIYPYSFAVFIFDFDNKKQMKSVLKKVLKMGVEVSEKFVKSAMGWSIRRNWIKGTIIFINRCESRNIIDIIGTIRHESQHAAANCFEHICHKGRLDSEPFQYLNDYIFKSILRAYNRDCNIFNNYQS